ncbi:MAG TPA: invasion associated locus B family protein [Rhizomicrobium sp.]|nr:invasion associated locus B family protein [Rhizomicrobium sp.]
MKAFESKWAIAIAGAVFAVALSAGQAAAQAQAGKPEQKQFDDWQVRCFPVQSPSPCDMFQELLNQQRNQRILAMSIAYVPSMDRYALQVTVPLGISIPNGLTIQTDSFTSPTLKYRRCDREGCYVETGVDKSLIEGIAKSSPDGKAKVNIVVDNGKKYGLTFFLKGFAAAHDDMVSEARAKAKAVTPPASGAAPAAPAPQQ